MAKVDNAGGLTKEQTRLQRVLDSLNTLDGGFAWEGFSPAGPSIHFVWDGQHYAIWLTSSRGASKQNQRYLRDMPRYKSAGSICGIIDKPEEIDEIISTDLIRHEYFRKLPLSQIDEQLRKWGDGDIRLDWLERLVMRLADMQKRVIMAIYVDRMTIRKAAEELGISKSDLQRMLHGALFQLIKWIVDGEEYTV